MKRRAVVALVAAGLIATAGHASAVTYLPKSQAAPLSPEGKQRLMERLAAGERLPSWLAALAVPGSEALPREKVSELARATLAAETHVGTRLATRPLRTLGTFPPANIPVSDPTGEALGIVQAGASIAMLGEIGLAAWNDGEGLVDTTLKHRIGVGVTTDGGTTWTDLGAPPAPVGAVWTNTPVVSVNDKTGLFWVVGLFRKPNANGIAIVSAPLGLGSVTWGPPQIVEEVSNSAALFDKEWLAADSLSGNLYLACTRYVPASNRVEVRRSTDGGQSWDTPVTLNSFAAGGHVQGSRVAVGPTGEAYAVWWQAGGVGQDTFYVKRSDDGGQSFGSQYAAAAAYTNFGSGAPGSNRPGGLAFPSMAVDRSNGPNRGRVYVTWNESFNFYDDPIGTLGYHEEVENNEFFNRATPFTLGERLEGIFASNSPRDRDYFQFSGNQGDEIICALDSLTNVVAYDMALYCASDSTAQMAYAGDPVVPGGTPSFIVYRLPASGDYRLRVQTLGASPGYYTVATGTSTPGPEPGRDQRDVMVALSPDGAQWSTPVRVNDSPIGYDDWLPEVAVAADGFAYIAWYDYRDSAPCGAASKVDIARSTDGGATWSANLSVADTPTPWSLITSNTAPNQGDRLGFVAGGLNLYPAWADGRLGDPDVYMARADLGFECHPPGDVSWVEGTVNDVDYTIINRSPFPLDLSYRLESTRDWPGLPITGTVTAPADPATHLVIGIPVPAGEPPGLNRVELKVWLTANPSVGDSCDNNLHDPTTAALASLVSAAATAEKAAIAWWVGVPGEVRVERAATTGAWQPREQRTFDVPGEFRYEDIDVRPGERYGYRVVVKGAGAEGPAGEVWLEIPAAALLALRGAQPNPASGDWSVAFTLADASPARLELIDVNGRRVLRREVGTLGPGAHVLPLARESATLPAGVYLLRLEQSGVSVVRRMALIR